MQIKLPVLPDIHNLSNLSGARRGRATIALSRSQSCVKTGNRKDSKSDSMSACNQVFAEEAFQFEWRQPIFLRFLSVQRSGRLGVKIDYTIPLARSPEDSARH